MRTASARVDGCLEAVGSPSSEDAARASSAALDLILSAAADMIAERIASSASVAEAEPWRLVDLEEAAAMLTRSQRWVRERVKRGELAVVRLDGGALAFDVGDLRAFAAARRIGGEAALVALETGWWER